MTKGINETKELMRILNDMYNEDTLNYNLDHSNKQKKFLNEVDNLEIIINALNNEADSLIASVDKISSMIIK